jgi:preprotein translocase subunit YajC
VPAIVFIVLLLAALWLLMIRPAQRRQREQQRLMSSMEVGDEIVTAGGLYGTVKALEEDEVRLEIAPGVDVRVARRAVAGVVSDKEPEAPQDALEEAQEEAEPAAEPEETKADTLSG